MVSKRQESTGNSTVARRVLRTPFAVAALIAVVSTSMLCRATRADSVYAWGYASDGELGNGVSGSGANGENGIPYSSAPVQVLVLDNNVTAIAAGNSHAMAIDIGALYAWGGGDIGNGSGLLSTTPVAVSGISGNATAISSGYFFSLAVAGGELYGWGVNSGGLGSAIPIHNTALSPVAIPGFSSGVSAMAAGAVTTYVIQNQAVYALGGDPILGLVGYLGNGSTANSLTPVAVTGMGSGVTAISAGMSDAFAIQGGALYAWGANSAGQLGIGSTSAALTPVSITSLTSNVTDVSAGTDHTLAIQNGHVFAWGAGGEGQLGNGTIGTSLTPLEVPGLPDDMVQVAAGSDMSFALSADGRLWAWGVNQYGSLGIGDSANDFYDTPQEVTPPAGYKFTSISAGVVIASPSYFAVATVAPIPEPASLGMLGAGVAILLLRRRRTATLQTPPSNTSPPPPLSPAHRTER